MGSEEPTSYMWRKMWRYSAGNRPRVVFYIALSVLANIVIFLQPLVVAYLLNTVQEEGVTSQNLTKLILICSLFVFLSVAFWLLHGPSRVIETKNAFHVRANYRRYLVEGVLALPPSWHTEHHSGDTIDKIEKGTAGLHRFSSNTFEIIETCIRLVSSLVALFYFNLSSGFVVIFFIIIAVAVVLHYNRTLRGQLREINHAENAASQKVFDYVSNITTVIILRMERIAASDIMKSVMKPFGTFSKYTKTNEMKWALVSFTAAMMMFGVIVAYLLHVVHADGAIMVGTLFALYSYVDRISGLFYRFAYRYSDIVEQKTAVENAEELTTDFTVRHPVTATSLGPWKRISIEHLTFSYDTTSKAGTEGEKQDHLHLKDTAFVLRRGEKIALVGESGSGKTTFLKLLRGLYTPEQVTVMLDKKRLSDLTALSGAITLIPQDPELFTTSVRENITMGTEHDDAAVREYTDIACFTEVADRLPNKLESSIKEKGVNLSGGEKQRLALSRGLLASQDAEIILMDEPTSSVDAKNERLIFENIFERYEKRTVISTVHRLHLLSLFDTIYYFKDGRIIAHGDLAQLRKRSAEFQKLWKKYHSLQRKEK
jgi:ABC-type multidrug transport system fused ATPase/permease subunit